MELSLGKFRRRNRLAVVFHHDAARQKLLRDQKFLDGAGEPGRHWLAVGGDERLIHLWGYEVLIVTSSLSPKILFFPAD